jgi:NitT/TauT family transport system ATP-binding protein
MNRGEAICVRHCSLAFRGKKREEEIRVLENIDLTVSRGEFVCLVGPSGCGK